MATFCHSPPDSSTPVRKRLPITWSYLCGSRSITRPPGFARAAATMRGRSVAGLDASDGDVVAGRQVVADEVLEDHADVAAKAVEVVVAQVVAIEQNPAFVRVVQPRQQLDQRRLAGAILADERDDFAAAKGEGQMPHRPALRARVNEANVFEHEPLAHRPLETAARAARTRSPAAPRRTRTGRRGKAPVRRPARSRRGGHRAACAAVGTSPRETSGRRW